MLFMKSQSYFGSDSMIHSLMMRNFDRDRLEMLVACIAGIPDAEWNRCAERPINRFYRVIL